MDRPSAAVVSPLDVLQHKSVLFSHIREFNAAVRGPDAQDVTAIVFDDVMAETQIHFMMEENLYSETSQRKYREHRCAHRRILAGMTQQRQLLLNAESVERNVEIAHSMDALLAHLIQD
jgi:hemerythrin